ncbi:hypothetical protein QT971_17665 [Microcoleus sp. herbarium19]|uniref:hypothetical protein n=1 Tax=unclassified Microcoleus TaxID=2642155 RepID=UPI002FCFD3FD
MTKVNFKANLIRETQTIGSIYFSYDDAAGSMTIGQEFSNNRNFFFLTSLILEINAGTSRLPGFENRISLDLSDRLAGLNLAYFEPENKASKSFGTVQQVEKAFFSMWIFPIASSANFLTDGISWGIDRLGTLSMADADVSGLVGAAEIVTPIVNEPIPLIGVKFPKQSSPVIRKRNSDRNSGRFLDPANCGCHILSEPSITRCFILCGILSN